MNPLNLAPELLAAGYSLSYEEGKLNLSKIEDLSSGNMVEFNYTITENNGFLIVEGNDERMEYLNWCWWNQVTNFLPEGNYGPPNSGQEK